MAINFEPPCYRLLVEKSNFKDPKSSHQRHICSRYFNHVVDVLLPAADSCPSQLTQLLQDQPPFFLLKSVNLKKLIAREFIEAFVKKGRLCLLSHQNHIDTEDSIAITPNGELVLNITKDTYQQLGLEGKPSRLNGKRRRKYVVTIALSEANFKKGHKIYDRVHDCFDRLSHLTFDLLLSWIPPDERIRASSVAVYFESLRVPVLTYQQTVEKKRLKIALPNIACDTDSSSALGASDLYEWLGAVANGIDCTSGAPDGDLSTYSVPADGKRVACVRLTLRGMLHAGSVQRTLDVLREHVSASSAPWASMTVHGFADAIMTCQSSEHGFHVSGDHVYTFVIFPDDHYWLYTATSTHDVGH